MSTATIQYKHPDNSRFVRLDVETVNDHPVLRIGRPDEPGIVCSLHLTDDAALALITALSYRVDPEKAIAPTRLSCLNAMSSLRSVVDPADDDLPPVIVRKPDSPNEDRCEKCGALDVNCECGRA